MAERALLIWPYIEKFVTTTLSGPKSKIPVIRSFQNLKEHILDPLSTAKLQFFITIAKVLTPFLKKFQSEEPMLPFMAEELTQFCGHFWRSSSRSLSMTKLQLLPNFLKLMSLRKKIYYHQRKWMLALLAKFFYEKLKPRKRQAHRGCWSSKMSVLF